MTTAGPLDQREIGSDTAPPGWEAIEELFRADVFPRNGGFQVAISYSTVPNEKMSVRASSVSPRAV